MAEVTDVNASARFKDADAFCWDLFSSAKIAETFLGEVKIQGPSHCSF